MAAQKHKFMCEPTSEFKVQSVSDLSIQCDHASCCTCICLQPGVTLEVAETKRHTY